jgi:hypothetical protein
MDTQPSTSPPAGGRRPQARVLGDYSGRGAATVADDLRRQGLRPGVQRVDAATPEEIGAILAQDPPPGAAVARNSVVTLYVGAAPHDPAANDRPRDRQPPDTEPASAGPRRRRKPGHAHAFNETPETSDVATRAHQAVENGTDGEAVTAWSASIDADGLDDRSPTGEPVGQIEVDPQDRVAPVGQRVHQDTPPSGSAPAVEPWEATAQARAVDARTLLTPLRGLPGRFALKRWRGMPRRARVTILGGVVCVLALLTLALAEHGEPSTQRATTSARQASPAAKQPGAGNATRSGPGSRGQHSRTPAYPPGQHAPGTARPVRSPHSNSPAAIAPPAQPPVTPPAAPPVPAPAASVVRAPAPRAPAPAAPAAASAPVVADGQIPGGPFSP